MTAAFARIYFVPLPKRWFIVNAVNRPSLCVVPKGKARDNHPKGDHMRKVILALAAVSLMSPAMVTPAAARHYYNGKVWKDSHGRWRCKRSNGTTGLLVGAAGGALVGRAIDTHGERATGTILGAAAGALIGRSIDRSRVRCR
jgi:hypothetical protein